MTIHAGVFHAQVVNLQIPLVKLGKGMYGCVSWLRQSGIHHFLVYSDVLDVMLGNSLIMLEIQRMCCAFGSC